MKLGLVCFILMVGCAKAIGDKGESLTGSKLVSCSFNGKNETYSEGVINIYVNNHGVEVQFKDGSSVKYAPGVPCKYVRGK